MPEAPNESEPTPDPDGEGQPSAASDDSKPSATLESFFAGFEVERSEQEKKYADLAASPNYARSLTKAAVDYLAEPEQFSPGDLVTWKASLKNRRFPAYGRPAVVIEIVEGRNIGPDEHRSSEEPIDLTLGLIDGDGDFMVFNYDRRRFTGWKASVAE